MNKRLACKQAYAHTAMCYLCLLGAAVLRPARQSLAGCLAEPAGGDDLLQAGHCWVGCACTQTRKQNCTRRNAERTND